MRRIIKDPSKLEKAVDGKLTAQGRKALSQAILSFMSDGLADQHGSLLKKRLQEWTDKNDFPDRAILFSLVEKFLESTGFDDSWRRIFKVLDFTGVRKSGFRMLTISNTITPELVPDGARANVWNITATTETVQFDKHGAALEWSKCLIEDDEWIQLEDIITSFRNVFMAYVAQVHYDAIEAAGDTKAAIAWQLPDPAALPNTDALYNASRDAQTINLGAQKILLANQNKGYGVTAASELVLLVPLQLRNRVRKALSLLLQPIGGSAPAVDYNITMAVTMMLTRTDRLRLCLPYGKNQSGIRLALEELKDVDILARSEIMADWTRFGCHCGDTDQIETLLLA